MTMEIPILILTFNRPKVTNLLFEKIRIYKPLSLYIASDGPRFGNSLDIELINQTRNIFKNIDWECEVKYLYFSENQGCKSCVNKAISWFFENVETGVILEDDCIPANGFFEFMEWGLGAFKDNLEIGMISGSNLIDFKYKSSRLNGFSSLINIWGWGSWKRVWFNHNLEPTKTEIDTILDKKLHSGVMDFLNVLFWKNLLKFTISKNSTWDFQLQLTFFKNNFYSVYPSRNLILNQGFGDSATHTSRNVPFYIYKSQPMDFCNLNYTQAIIRPVLNKNRDIYLQKTIWNYSVFSIIKLRLRNIFNYYN